MLSVLLLLTHSFVPHNHPMRSSGVPEIRSCANADPDSFLAAILSAFEQDLGDEHLSAYQGQSFEFTLDIDFSSFSIPTSEFGFIKSAEYDPVVTSLGVKCTCLCVCNFPQRGPPVLS